MRADEGTRTPNRPITRSVDRVSEMSTAGTIYPAAVIVVVRGPQLLAFDDTAVAIVSTVDTLGR